MRHTAAWWAERMAEIAAGADARAVARRHGVREKTLLWWKTELRRRERDSGTPRMLPVVVKPAPAAAPSQLEVFVELGAARITLRGAVSPEHVAAIVSASAGAC